MMHLQVVHLVMIFVSLLQESETRRKIFYSKIKLGTNITQNSAMTNVHHTSFPVCMVTLTNISHNTVVPVMNGHPRDQAKVSVHCRWPLIRGTDGKKSMVLYSAVSSPLDRSKRFTLSSPGRPVHSDTVLGFSWKHSGHVEMSRGIDKVAVHSRWPLTTGVAQGRYYCSNQGT